jgi:hypothetical protein
VQYVTTTYVPRTSGVKTFAIAPFYVFAGDVIRIEMDVVKQTGNQQIDYEEAANFWATYTNAFFTDVQGLFDEVANDNAYDLDLYFIPADVSPAWDLLAASYPLLIPADEPTP